MFSHLKSILSYSLILAFIFTTTGLRALQPDKHVSLYTHMYEVNKEWSYYESFCPDQSVEFRSDLDRIQTHLNLVCKYLSQHTPENLTAEQLEQRTDLINSLSDYASKKVFPTNHYHNVRTPYFVDNFGVHCAVGYLMFVSGSDELVSNIRRDHNYDYIRDIKTPGVAEWASDHGFTVDELKWIQPSYTPLPVLDSVSHGTNAPINDLVYDSNQDKIIFSGDFTTVDQMPCLHIGQYENGQLSCIGSGIDGTINDIFVSSNGIYAIGSLDDNGVVAPIAKYDGSVWTYFHIPGRTGASGSAGYIGDASHSMEVSIKHSSNPGVEEIWYYSNSGSWIKKAEVHGYINDIRTFATQKAYGGEFDLIVSMDGTGNILDSVQTNNIVLKDNSADTWSAIGSGIDGPVNVLKTIGSDLYIGCECSNSADNICLARYVSGILEELASTSDFYSSTVSIIDIEYTSSDKLTIGGEFEVGSMMYPSTNIAEYDLTYEYVYPLTVLDAKVTGLATDNTGLLFIGGHFTTYPYASNLNHLATYDAYVTGINDPSKIAIQVYPNPFVDKIQLEEIEGNPEFVLYNVSGQMVVSGTVSHNQINGLDGLSRGIYVLEIRQTGNTQRISVKKQ